MAKQLIYTGSPIVDKECKKCADDFMSAVNTDGDVVYLLTHCVDASRVNDEIAGKGLVLNFGDVQFLIYLDETKHILGTSKDGRNLLSEFKNNTLLLRYLKNVLKTTILIKE